MAVPVLSAIAATGVARAQASGKVAVAPPATPPSGATQASTTAGDVFESPLRRALRTRFGATFSAEFTEAELSDAQEVLTGMEGLVGDLKQFHLTFKREPLNQRDAQIDRSRGIESPLLGYVHLGRTDQLHPNPDGSYPMYLAPKTALDEFARLERASGTQPKGEEGHSHNFKWTMSHEITHELTFQVGLGFELARKGQQPASPSPLYTEWLSVAETVRHKARPLGEGEQGQLKNERPQGFPTLKSYYPDRAAGSDGEQVADCGAYLSTGSTYADGDKLLRLKLDFTRRFFAQIKSGQLKPMGATAPSPLRNGA